ncbi:hypothetical protein [Clostridium scatologenes]|uniref:Uncharacterized protein n=1 Tax=Clostridium scatologenes TaxID=1548 RepID=A0A0E3K3Z3_CLOSL|nr:hypothetical protein [Clostridium scatologenes]AKA72008.1 hypothetical protein CSCA_4883 [Clostridium scatologenes]
MSIKVKLTNKQKSAQGMQVEDDGKNSYRENERKKQNKNNNVNPN